MREIRWTWSAPQSEALLSEAPFVDVEGGIRSGKTTVANAKTQIIVSRYPGARCLLARWSEQDLFAELVPKWRAFAQTCGLDIRWNPKEQYDEILHTAGVGPDGLAHGNSVVYLRGLRSSDLISRYGAVRGLDLCFFQVEQAEEVPSDYWPELVGRLSQAGYPHQGWLTPQPVNEDHWIAKQFPTDNRDPRYHYIRTNVYDNAAHVGAAYIAQLEASYPLGSAQRRTLLEGRRGLAVHGEAVYGGYFHRRVHERAVEMNPHVPLLEGWDFGQRHPCVSWWQLLPIGRLQCLGAVMGSDLFLEDFAPIALTYRNRWCPSPLEVWSVGDPAGLDISNQGTETTKVRDILAEHGVAPVSQPHANRPEIRFQATQTIGAFMRRFALDGDPAFAVHPRAILVDGQGLARPATFHSDGFEAGYVWDTRVLIGLSANIRRPKKDGYYDHFQNTGEYVALAFAPGAQPTKDAADKAARKAQRRAQRDEDPDAAPRRRAVRLGGRGGY